MTDFREKSISWRDAEEHISEGTVQSLAKLQRSEGVLRQYRAFREQVLCKWETLLDYMRAQVFDCSTKAVEDGKISAHLKEHVAKQENPTIAWRKNDFPYNFEQGIDHHVLWSTKPLATEELTLAISTEFPSHETLYWINPPELQSIGALWHCHVLSRPKA
ncbi:hypothetical protein CEUSTIGMA_g8943.t1 [Chlamydomonas eustigma]|uniref:Uncharacterized protein n=1 Tax=Chlamydomonas eustigma TaxID=1157962 RepID=A0A250XEL3_9CHLO|nr:hypothetical protein CEUSTIGMA_g8943.t1 [Chlamydomonas eustigma]|eukprot:GAX81515.1 hypothetical protein CEUSTIGMA_g8943.t1 [Chlamydomonas eustigma]